MPDPYNLPITPDDVARAAERIRGVANRTAVFTSRSLDERLGAQVFLKAESMQRGAAFKLRGAYNTVASLTREELDRGVVASMAYLFEHQKLVVEPSGSSARGRGDVRFGRRARPAGRRDPFRRQHRRRPLRLPARRCLVRAPRSVALLTRMGEPLRAARRCSRVFGQGRLVRARRRVGRPPTS